MNTNLEQAPETIKNIPAEFITDLDVRPVLKSGGEPFSAIMEAVAKTSENGALRLRATFEPTPLFRVLGSKGWTHWVQFGADDDWMIWFYREANKTEEKKAFPISAGLKEVMQEYPELSKRLEMTNKHWALDVRDLPPPEPMEMTLAVLDQMPEDVCMIQTNQRVPQFLLPLLDERGLGYKVLKEEENNVLIEIKRK